MDIIFIEMLVTVNLSGDSSKFTAFFTRSNQSVCRFSNDEIENNDEVSQAQRLLLL